MMKKGKGKKGDWLVWGLGAVLGVFYLWPEYKASRKYGVPMFSAQLRALRAQDAGFNEA